MSYLQAFEADYFRARDAFREAATLAGATLYEYPIDATGPSGERLTIDVARIGSASPEWVLSVSSGVHGVEGLLGSAVSIAWLRSPAPAGLSDEGAVVLIHAVNPHGFSWLRRTNEDNIDLNRNFLVGSQEYAGEPEGYEGLSDFLNPESPPSRFEPFAIKTLWKIATRGMSAFKRAVAVGQYEYPRGLFFGGKGSAQSTRIVQENYTSWIGTASRVFHLDFHTGLGKYGTYKLLALHREESPEYMWLVRVFDERHVESIASQIDRGTAYPARGVLGEWLEFALQGRDFRFAAAEFGTYNVIRVLGALRSENRAHFHCEPSDRVYARAKTHIAECFCPEDPKWRRHVVEEGLRMLRKGVEALR